MSKRGRPATQTKKTETKGKLSAGVGVHYASTKRQQGSVEKSKTK